MIKNKGNSELILLYEKKVMHSVWVIENDEESNIGQISQKLSLLYRRH